MTRLTPPQRKPENNSGMPGVCDNKSLSSVHIEIIISERPHRQHNPHTSGRAVPGSHANHWPSRAASACAS